MLLDLNLSDFIFFSNSNICNKDKLEYSIMVYLLHEFSHFFLSEMFKFNFNQEDSDEKLDLQNETEKGDAKKCIEHKLKVDYDIAEQNVMETEGLRHVISAEAVKKIQEKPEYLSEKSDLVKNVYEGGLKIWECSIDLVQYLKNNQISLNKSLKVLELGCGAALPGLYCLNKVNEVHFQDYNNEVIEHITIPNAALNTSETKTRFFSGDWTDFLAKMNQESTKYDLILTSETIYEVANYSKLIDIFDTLLDSNGKILVAAKIHYFGVGGSLGEFEKHLKPKWKVESVFENCDSVKREIILLERCQ